MDAAEQLANGLDQLFRQRSRHTMADVEHAIRAFAQAERQAVWREAAGKILLEFHAVNMGANETVQRCVRYCEDRATERG